MGLRVRRKIDVVDNNRVLSMLKGGRTGRRCKVTVRGLVDL